MKQSCILLLVLFSTACSTAPTENKFLAQPGSDYVITARDYPLDQRFLITIKSTSDRDICLYEGIWPNQLTYHQSSNRGERINHLDANIQVKSSTTSYIPRKPTTVEHCQTDTVEEAQKLCSQRLEPGQIRSASLPYKYFDLNILEDEDKEKKLNYTGNLTFCDVFP